MTDLMWDEILSSCASQVAADVLFVASGILNPEYAAETISDKAATYESRSLREI